MTDVAKSGLRQKPDLVFSLRFDRMLADNLPVELLMMTFNHLLVEHLLDCSRVCRHWRSVVHSCLKFCCDVRIAASSPSAFEFFAFRTKLNERGSLRVNIDIWDESTKQGSIPNDLLVGICEILRSQMHRMECFRIRSGGATIQAILELGLTVPAPELRQLYLCAWDNAAHIRPDLFAGVAPCLRRVVLSDVLLPTQPAPALLSAEWVDFLTSAPSMLPATFFTHFASVQYLYLKGIIDLDPRAIDDEHFKAPPRLEYIKADLFCADGTTYASFAKAVQGIDGVQQVVCMHPTPDIISLYLCHIPGPIRLYIALADSDGITLGFSEDVDEDVSPCRQRRFRGYDLVDGLTSDIFSRIVYFTIHTRLLDLIHRIETMPVCIGLELVAKTAGVEDLLQQSDDVRIVPIRCIPRLRNLSFGTSYPNPRIAMSYVRWLFDMVVAPCASDPPLRLSLADFTVDGDKSELGTCYDLVDVGCLVPHVCSFLPRDFDDLLTCAQKDTTSDPVTLPSGTPEIANIV